MITEYKNSKVKSKLLEYAVRQSSAVTSHCQGASDKKRTEFEILVTRVN